ncbi:MAG: hypothetical protein ACI9CF_000361 [Candidatus Omnitrophota bacterium]|jgi:hypothetical protein
MKVLMRAAVLCLAINCLALGVRTEIALAKASAAASLDQIKIAKIALWQELMLKKISFQNELHGIAIKQWPELTTSFTNYRDYQLNLIHRKILAFNYRNKEYLIDEKTATGLNEFLNFNWDIKEANTYMRQISGFKETQIKIVTLKNKLDQDPSFAMLTDAFTKLAYNAKYITLMKGMARDLEKAQIILSNFDKNAAV